MQSKSVLLTLTLTLSYPFLKKLMFYHFLKSRYTQKKNVFQIFSIWWEVTLSCGLFILNIRKTVRTRKKEFNHVVCIELFTAHLFERTSRFYHLPTRRYLQNK